MVIILLSVNSIYAQFVWQDRVYSPIMKTVRLESVSSQFAIPTVGLEQAGGLLLSFDELSEETHRYEYTLIHCNSDWTQSSLQPSDYIDGFETGIIGNYANSFNTLQRYVHYSQPIPSETMRLTKSGNYIIKVYKEGNEDEVVFTKRFYCLDRKANVAIDVMIAREPAARSTCQEVDVRVSSTDGLSFDAPTQRVKVLLRQNGREDTKRILPLSASRGTELAYNFRNENVFEAGNVFRIFDFTSIRNRSQYVENIDYVAGENVVRLKKEEVKARSPFVSHSDIRGEYYIRNEVDDNYELCSDYAWVCFYLPMPLSLEGNYYAVGAMSDWRFSEQNKFTFDSRENLYVLRMLLKQGYYNYHILYVPHGYTQGEFRRVEGNHSETQNRYDVFVYYRELGNDYESLIGVSSAEYRY